MLTRRGKESWMCSPIFIYIGAGRVTITLFLHEKPHARLVRRADRLAPSRQD